MKGQARLILHREKLFLNKQEAVEYYDYCSSIYAERGTLLAELLRHKGARRKSGDGIFSWRDFALLGCLFPEIIVLIILIALSVLAFWYYLLAGVVFIHGIAVCFSYRRKLTRKALISLVGKLERIPKPILNEEKINNIQELKNKSFKVYTDNGSHMITPGTYNEIIVAESPGILYRLENPFEILDNSGHRVGVTDIVVSFKE